MMIEKNNNEFDNFNSDGINISDRAISEFLKIKRQKNIPDNYGLRIGIKGGGCSGFAYSLGFDAKSYPTDHILDFNGLKVFIDMKSYLFLPGAILDYKEGENGIGFVVDNPNIKNTCGCGSSIKK